MSQFLRDFKAYLLFISAVAGIGIGLLALLAAGVLVAFGLFKLAMAVCGNTIWAFPFMIVEVVIASALIAAVYTAVERWLKK